MPEVTICIVPNQGRVKQDQKGEVKYLPYNAELPQALRGKKVGDRISFKTNQLRNKSILNKMETNQEVIELLQTNCALNTAQTELRLIIY